MEQRLFDEAPQAGQKPEKQEFLAAARSSQLAVWSPELRASWRQDLLDAQVEERNLINEKFIYMLKRTNPERYVAMKDSLPAPSLEKLWLADWICQAQAIWQEAIAKKYPHLVQYGWTGREDADGGEAASFETSLWSELMTCSVHTLRLYASQVERAQKAGSNLRETIWENTVRQLGYGSLETMEESVLRKAE